MWKSHYKQHFHFGTKTLNYQRDLVLSLCDKLLLPQELLTHKLADLSGGEAQRFGVLRALLLQPTLLLLDEPASNLDTEARERLAKVLGEWLDKGERAIVLCSHEPSWCEALVTDYWTLSAGSQLEHRAKSS